MTKKFVVWFGDVGKEDVATVGGKGANLGEMTQAGFPVPPGFIVTVDAYNEFLDRTNLRNKIASVLSGVDVNNTKSLESASKKVQEDITRAAFPKDIALEIIHAYFK